MSKKTGWHIFKATINCLFYCGVIVGICYLFSWCYGFMYQAFSNPVYDSSSAFRRTIVVEEGENSLAVMKALEDKEVVGDYRVAYVRLVFSKYNGNIQPGSYHVAASMSLDTILGTLAQDSEIIGDTSESTESTEDSKEQ